MLNKYFFMCAYNFVHGAVFNWGEKYLKYDERLMIQGQYMFQLSES